VAKLRLACLLDPTGSNRNPLSPKDKKKKAKLNLIKSGNKGKDDDETNYVENDDRKDGDDKANDISDNDNNY